VVSKERVCQFVDLYHEKTNTTGTKLNQNIKIDLKTKMTRGVKFQKYLKKPFSGGLFRFQTQNHASARNNSNVVVVPHFAQD